MVCDFLEAELTTPKSSCQEACGGFLTATVTPDRVLFFSLKTSFWKTPLDEEPLAAQSPWQSGLPPFMYLFGFHSPLAHCVYRSLSFQSLPCPPLPPRTALIQLALTVVKESASLRLRFWLRLEELLLTALRQAFVCSGL